MADPAGHDAPRGDREETGYVSSYADFAKTLRTWFVAYGIGGPVLFLTQPELAKRLAPSGQSRFVALLFLSGVALQILQALLYKVAMWYLYLGELKRAIRSTGRYRASEWVPEALWLELMFDVGTIVLFAWATLKLLLILSEILAGAPGAALHEPGGGPQSIKCGQLEWSAPLPEVSLRTAAFP